MRKEILRMENVLTDDSDGNNLRNLYFQMYEGEIMGVIGINEYGMDRLIEIICYNTPIKYGRIYFQEKMVNHHRYVRNIADKACVIGRNDQLVNSLSVLENIFVLRKGGKSFFINRNILRREVQHFLTQFQLDINPNEKIKYLSAYEQCIVELLKAYIHGIKLVIFNKATSRLSDKDEEKFMVTLKRMTQDGISAIILDSHHEELLTHCDRLALFRDGKIIKVIRKEELSPQLMGAYGFSLKQEGKQITEIKTKQEIILNDWNTENLKNFSVSLHAGESILLYDKSNKIQYDIISQLCGEEKSKGEIVFGGSGKVLSADYLKKDVAIIEENPLETMLFYQSSYMENLCFLMEKKLPVMCITSSVKKSIQREYMKVLGAEVKTRRILGLDKKSLYNLIYYRVHLLNPRLVFIVQPFLNTDLSIRHHIVSLIQVLKDQGIAVVILTSNIADADSVSDRLCLIEDGIVKKEYTSSEFESVRMEI